ncbi:MAG: PDZ domain-containing protein [bacterium]
MMNSRKISGAKIILGAVFLLFTGFIIGTLQVDFFSIAKPDDKKYTGEQVPKDRPKQAIQSARNIEDAFNYAASRVRPAVVTIYTQKNVKVRRGFPFQFGPGSPAPDDPLFRRFFGEPRTETRKVRGLGTGIKDVDEINVMLNNNQSVEAEIVGTDPMGNGTDLAVIKIDRTNLPTVSFANSDEITPGDWSIAIGSPFQLENSVSVGHVSATQRSVSIGGNIQPNNNNANMPRFGHMIQTDAAINKGNSGGPLVNIEGEVIGVNTMIHSTSGGSQGIGFAIASNIAQRVSNELIEYGRVRRPWMGVVIETLSEKALKEHFDEQHGVIVSRVVEGSPAQNAGIKHGDLIVKFDGKTVNSPAQLQKQVWNQDIGDEVDLVVNRNGTRKTLTMKLDKMPGQTDKASTQQKSESLEPLEAVGLNVITVEPEEANSPILRIERPVLRVSSVKSNSPAEQAGLQREDLILEVDGKPIEEPDELSDHLENQMEEGASTVLIRLNRGHNIFHATLPLPQ